MKSLIAVMAALFLTCSVTYGQLSLRPQVGINFASFSNDILDSEWSSNVGYQFGVDLQIGSRLYIQPGLNYQSTKLTFEGVEEVSFTTNRLNIPILVGFKLFEQESKAFGLRGFAGPNLAMHLGESFDDAITGLTKDDFKSAHFSLLAGAGLDISILFIDVAYKFGISNYIEVDNEDSNQNIFLVNAGVRLGF